MSDKGAKPKKPILSTQEIKDLLDRGVSSWKIRKLGVSPKRITNISKGIFAGKRGRKAKFTEEHKNYVTELSRADPSISNKTIRAMFLQQFGCTVSSGKVSLWLNRKNSQNENVTDQNFSEMNEPNLKQPEATEEKIEKEEVVEAQEQKCDEEKGKEEAETEEKTENNENKEKENEVFVPKLASKNQDDDYSDEDYDYGEEEENESNDEDWAPVIPELAERDRSLDDDPYIMTLDKLPTWAQEGPEIIKENPPTKFTPEHAANTEINEKISFWMRGNSAKLAADAVVNAANAHLAPGGGICGVLHSAAGHKMAEECYKIGYTPTGRCAVTKGYNLPAKYCIHTVGPIGEDPKKLKLAYESTLACIDGKNIRSVGLCCISTGIYGYPIKPATKIALETVHKFLEVPENREKTDRIIFVVFEKRDVAVYNYLRHVYFPLDVEYKFEEDKKKADAAPVKSSTQPAAIKTPLQYIRDIMNKAKAEEAEEEENKETNLVEEEEKATEEKKEDAEEPAEEKKEDVEEKKENAEEKKDDVEEKKEE